MALDTSKLLGRIAELMAMGETALRSERGDRTLRYLEKGPCRGFRVASLSFIGTLFGTSHTHYQEFDKFADGHFRTDIEQGMAILGVIRVELEQGWLRSLSSLVAADVFEDFLDMADHLLAERYKDAAAVMIGSVLEGHLRRLCTHRGIDTETVKNGSPQPKKADLMNSELAKAGAYGATDQKLVTGWLGHRNDAAHGHYSRYTQEQIENMVSGVRAIMSKIGA